MHKNGCNKSQVEYWLIRREMFKERKDCKVIPEDRIVTQHTIIVVGIK